MNGTRKQLTSRVVPVRTPGRWITVTKYREEWKTYCYKVPEYKCFKVPCYSGGYCDSGYAPCSQSQQSTKICPESTAQNGAVAWDGDQNSCQSVCMFQIAKCYEILQNAAKC